MAVLPSAFLGLCRGKVSGVRVLKCWAEVVSSFLQVAGLKPVTEHFWALLMAWPGQKWLDPGLYVYSGVAFTCLPLSFFVLSSGAQLQTQGFVGSAGCVCRCVTHVCCFWDPGAGR